MVDFKHRLTFISESNLEQGAQAHCGYLCQRSYSTMGEAEIDHLRVPAIFQFIVNGNRLSLELARRFQS